MDKTLLEKVKAGVKFVALFKPRDQKLIRKHAHDAALYILMNGVDYQELNDVERDILQDIAIRLLVKYFNGREMKLLTPEYTLAEATDITIERHEEISNLPKFIPALAQLIAALDEFFKAHDKGEIHDDD